MVLMTIPEMMDQRGYIMRRGYFGSTPSRLLYDSGTLKDDSCTLKDGCGNIIDESGMIKDD